jgi:hypothetical protein
VRIPRYHLAIGEPAKRRATYADLMHAVEIELGALWKR